MQQDKHAHLFIDDREFPVFSHTFNFSTQQDEFEQSKWERSKVNLDLNNITDLCKITKK